MIWVKEISQYLHLRGIPDSKVHGDNMGPTGVPWTLLSGMAYFATAQVPMDYIWVAFY